MKRSFLTAQTTAVFWIITFLGMPIGVGRAESHSGWLSDVRALGPRMREDDE